MIQKISDFIYRVTGVIITILLVSIVFLTFVQVLSRYVFKFSIDWAQELVVYIMVWLVFLGCSMGMRDGEVATLTIVTEKLDRKKQKILGVISNILIIVFSVVSAYYNREVIGFAMQRKSPIMGIRMGYVSFPFTVLSVIVAFNCIISITNLLKSKEHTI